MKRPADFKYEHGNTLFVGKYYSAINDKSNQCIFKIENCFIDVCDGYSRYVKFNIKYSNGKGYVYYYCDLLTDLGISFINNAGEIRWSAEHKAAIMERSEDEYLVERIT
tara:strand:- start:1478 stop:1804 length:327 start_codon:yes stop_codon:yes gene_type:complete